MRISERQIQQLIFFCTHIPASEFSFSQRAREDVHKLLAEIANQQSSVLKDIDDDQYEASKT